MVVFATGRPATPNLLQSSSGCGPTVQLGSVSDWFPPLKMGLTLSSVFGRLFGKKQMRILMGKDVIAFFLNVARDILRCGAQVVMWTFKCHTNIQDAICIDLSEKQLKPCSIK